MLLLLDGTAWGQQRRTAPRGSGKTTAKQIDLSFGADPSTPVFVMNDTGGFQLKTPAGFVPTPQLAIYPDGRIVAGTRSPKVKVVEGKIDLVELKAFLSYATGECHFFDLTTASIKATTGKADKAANASLTEIKINLDKHKHAVSIEDLAKAAAKHKSVPSIAAMSALASKAKLIAAKTSLGSQDQAESTLRRVNKALADKVPSAPPFTLQHLLSAVQYADGRTIAAFSNGYQAEGKQIRLHGSFSQSAAGESVANVVILPKPSGSGRRN